MLLQKTRIGLASLLIGPLTAVQGAALACCLAKAEGGASAPSRVAEKSGKIVCDVKGMTCGGCGSAIEGRLKKTKGVKKAEVSFEMGQAVVEFDPARTSEKKILTAIRKAGYKAEVKEAGGE
jgi:copper chaperone CopZ